MRCERINVPLRRYRVAENWRENVAHAAEGAQDWCVAGKVNTIEWRKELIHFFLYNLFIDMHVDNIHIF